ncbi:MAG TPA: hypothetical protein VIM11_22620 [Tepidisphaeraceae bacterium]|jgi:hypothetical protein
MTLQSSVRISRSSPLAIAAIALMMGVTAFGAAPPQSPPQQITTIDQVQFQQTNAQAQMEELQNRMFRLAEATREAEPDDAAKLLMAVRAAREQLILEQMRGNLNLLNGKDYTHAAEEQVKIIAKLEELKKLLTSGVSDLQMLLEKLRALDQAIKKLDAATTEEKRQSNTTGNLAAKPAEQKPLDNLKHDQEQNRKATDNIAQAVKNLGGGAKSAGEKLGSASQSMAKAEGALGSGKPSFAVTQQTDAVASMQEARKHLTEEHDKVMAEVEKLVRKQIVMNLTEMLDRQKSVRAGTEQAVAHLASSQGQRETLLKIRQLGETETSIVRIADQTIELIEQTQFSLALPPALRHVQQRMATIAAALDDSHADAKLVDSEIQVERDLQDLLDTFKELAASKVTPGNCNCKGDHNKLEAELKVVRLMQLRVNDETVRTDGERGGAAPVAIDLPANINPLLRDKILAVRDGQSEVKTALDKIHQQLEGPDNQGQAGGQPK